MGFRAFDRSGRSPSIETPSAEVPAAARVPEDSASSSGQQAAPLGRDADGAYPDGGAALLLGERAACRRPTAQHRVFLGLALTRATATEVRAAFGAEAQDPLVLDFADTEAELRDFGFRFDLHGDGSEVNSPLPTSGKGRSSCSIAMVMAASMTDGSSSVRLSTGDGFGELAARDADGNGWIDESATSAWSQLYVWHPYRRDALIALPEADVGAIGLARRRRRTTDGSQASWGCCAARESICASRARPAPSRTST